jgi:hypothetical protein
LHPESRYIAEKSKKENRKKGSIHHFVKTKWAFVKTILLVKKKNIVFVMILVEIKK